MPIDPTLNPIVTQEILDYLDADVICLQETKITRSKLDTDLALVPGYDSYWSFHRTKSGYSGVAIYVKDHIKLLAAEEGISGVLSGNFNLPDASFASNSSSSAKRAAFESIDLIKKRVGGYPNVESDGVAALTRFQELDNEGRGIVLDFGFFVLFNLYCPNETDETRLPFKMDYYHLLEARVRELIQEGREVIVMGDMNAIPTELDHCDPAKWKKESGEDDFTNTLPRRWFNSFLAPSGPLTDLFRVFHKDEPGAFTCWNTKINARPSNYGTRLDYILVTSGLLPWFKSCDRKPNVVGSDHCPVVAEMFTELALEKLEGRQDQDRQKTQRLQDILDSYGGTSDHSLAARFFDEFSGKQQKLSAFFKKPIQSPTAPAATTSTPESTLASLAQMGASNKRQTSSDSSNDQGVRKKAFFSSEKSSSDIQSSIPSSDQSVSRSISTTATSTGLIPKSNNKSAVKSGPVRSAQDKGATKKSAGSKSSGQQSMLSFFSSSSKRSSSTVEAAASGTAAGESRQAISSSSQLVDQGLSSSSQQSSADSSLLSQQNEPSPVSTSTSLDSTTVTSSSSFSPNDFADWIPSSQDVLPFSINGESTTSKWQSLFQPKAIPKCRFHGAPCTEYTVSKKGPNKGRRFFLCSL
ncbi:Class II abasic (AP) endonuclease [Dissophora ornata]|nr:Class II abasic (AP) endonuclease [Dissophora ornata]